MAIESKSKFSVNEATVTVAGTAIQLPDISVGEACDLVIKAKRTNRGAIKIGESATQAQAGKFTMEPGEAVKLCISNANKVYADAEVSGDKVEIIVEQ
ncbi:MAG: hypothetical protein A2283_18315 [Lentisphaerae bacterium RIFOXYA12_FULL_48_11]|nr:MAG: hypothetical protein A2259_01900 [Candidatus Moranbacteria bacterium RIFOXYA2_FULL_43_15]OGV64765.1 MAG: hypothetical protein A2283_18315 [Lentisphaerae bacterium RIFOXYA12_FULL_48_11]